jgi:hypothetical protein
MDRKSCLAGKTMLKYLDTEGEDGFSEIRRYFYNGNMCYFG